MLPSQPKKITSINKFNPVVNKVNPRNTLINISIGTPIQSKRSFLNQSPSGINPISARVGKNTGGRGSTINSLVGIKHNENEKNSTIEGSNSLRYIQGIKIKIK